MLSFTDKGIYCAQGDFYIDPWKPVDKAVVTHAHSDHARPGMNAYLAHRDTVPVMRHRLGADIRVRAVEFGEQVVINGVHVSLHPAGHIIGSAQVRVEYKGEVWVVSGDYKLSDDGFSQPFEPVRCQHFITESTFALPIFRWPAQEQVMQDISQWWSRNREKGVSSVLFAYALGKAQRIINHIDAATGPVYTHGAVEYINEVLRAAGHDIAPTTLATPALTREAATGSLVIAPPMALDSPWLRRFHPFETAMASGWMMVRGMKRRRNMDRGFVLSDHADWNELLQAVKLSGAENIYATHGYSTIFSRYLREQGYNARVVETAFEGEESGEALDD